MLEFQYLNSRLMLELWIFMSEPSWLRARIMELRLDYHILKKPRSVLITTGIVVLIYNMLFYFHPANQNWLSNGDFNWTNSLRFLLLEQYLIELITTTILFLLIDYFTKWQKLYNISLLPSAIFKYLARFLPLFAIAFFIFNPVTQSARYLLNEYTNLSSAIYLDDYLLNWSLYPVYIIPVFLTGYGVLISNLILHHNKQLASAEQNIESLSKPTKYIKKLLVFDDWGEVPLDCLTVLWFEKEERKYFAHTQKSKLRTRETLSELESSLDPDKFVRINRSVIVNVDFILNYSFWENEKYVLRLKNKAQTEFVMSRDRLKKIKSQLQLNS